MMDGAATSWQTYAEACAFLGNSLLKPMTQTADVGLDPAFWESFPDFGSDAVAQAAQACARYAQTAREAADAGGGDPVLACAVEYTKLFVGPPRPAAAPWETMHRHESATVGFGEATFEMRRLLREAGLELSNENRQYEDHLGIELLYLSELCRRAAVQQTGGQGDGELGVSLDAIAAFVREHPLSWVGKLRASVAETYPDGYFVGLLGVVEALLERLAEEALRA